MGVENRDSALLAKLAKDVENVSRGIAELKEMVASQGDELHEVREAVSRLAGIVENQNDLILRVLGILTEMSNRSSE